MATPSASGSPAAAPTRHQRVDDLNCSCGWEGFEDVPDMRWEQHVEGGPVHDLPDFVASDASTSGDPRPMSCSELEEWLFGCLDNAHSENVVLADALEAIGRGRKDAAGYATSVLAELQRRWDEEA